MCYQQKPSEIKSPFPTEGQEEVKYCPFVISTEYLRWINGVFECVTLEKAEIKNRRFEPCHKTRCMAFVKIDGVEYCQRIVK